MKISDEARELAYKVTQPYGFYDCNFTTALNDAEHLIQRALDAARNCALEDAAAMTSNSPDGWNAERHAEAIRAMKVQP